ncbi:DUF4383 domain-containing protein [Natronosporangium hydrolyticum]|uniref:DUF4383 domain-containing protein n=1 Tax=Natronosporangium hydrolyticum TaxID=2811111 RepID=A0A895YC90_9ACTN|nr:DUF4383 domain-containing protein [Natronosporangium hydrolyticum]QSB15444.1 DUF4383 domain-containing protein [Natronosporangium hydrolyticum]
MWRVQSHLPINHPAGPYLRVLAGLAGLYVLAFGVAGLIETWGAPVFDRSETWVLGLRTNPAFSGLSTVVGLVLVGGAIYGRNLCHFINYFGGIVFLVAGLAMMTLLYTELNLLNYAMRNSIVSFVIGLILLLAALYGRIGSDDAAYAEEQLRHGELIRRELGEEPGTPPGTPRGAGQESPSQQPERQEQGAGRRVSGRGG